MRAFVNYALPCVGSCGLVDNLWPVLGQCLVCLMVRLVVTRLFALFGSGFESCVGIWPFGLRRFLGIDCAAGGCPVHGPAHLLVESAAEVGFQWDPDVLGWGRIRFLQLCAQGRVSGEEIFQALCSSLTLAMFGKETRLCSEVYLLGVFGMAFFFFFQQGEGSASALSVLWW